MENNTTKPNEKSVEVIKKDVSAQVLAKIQSFIETGTLRLPKDYSAENALKAAYLVLIDDDKKPLEKCTKESVANALLKMVIYGLSPLKKQCDFIPYGTTLNCQIEYTGNIALARRYGNLKTIKANAIFKGEEFIWEIDPATGCKKIIAHKQTMETLGSKEVVGAYAVYTLNDGTTDVEIMNIEQIRAAWNQGAAKGNSPAHKNFPDQMAIKTVINRACKLLIRSSDDGVLFDDDDETITASPAKREVSANANVEEIGFTDVEQQDATVEKPTTEQQQGARQEDIDTSEAGKIPFTVPD